MDWSPPGSSVHGILQARMMGGKPFPSPRDLTNPGIEAGSLALQADSLWSEPWGKLHSFLTHPHSSLFSVVICITSMYTDTPQDNVVICIQRCLVKCTQIFAISDLHAFIPVEFDFPLIQFSFSVKLSLAFVTVLVHWWVIICFPVS